MTRSEVGRAESAPSLVKRLPDRFNLGWHCSDRWVDAGRGDDPAIHHADGVLTYRGLSELSDRVGQVLRANGLSRGESFLVRLHGSPMAYATLVAGLKLGAVPIPTAAVLGERELEHIVQIADISMAVVGEGLQAAVRSVRARTGEPARILTMGRPGADEEYLPGLVATAPPGSCTIDTSVHDPAFALFTSGTTGTPKGVVHAHRAYNVAAGNPCGRWAMGLSSDDRVLQPHDLAWSYSFGCGLLFPLAEGASVIAPRGRPDAASVEQDILRYQPTILATVPTLLRRILARWDEQGCPDLGPLRFAMSAGEPLPMDVQEAWRQTTGIDAFDHIGQVELNVFIANPPSRKPVPGSLGFALPGYDVAVLDRDGHRCTDDLGHLVVDANNPGLFVRYLGPGEVRAHPDGWYRTGDLARVDAAGRYWFIARDDDLIISRGYSVSPFEVEEAISEHPGVAEVGVVGVHDADVGQTVLAVVVLREGHPTNNDTEDELKAFLRSRIAAFKVPGRISFVAELPRTPTGKLRRQALR